MIHVIYPRHTITGCVVAAIYRYAAYPDAEITLHEIDWLEVEDLGDPAGLPEINPGPSDLVVFAGMYGLSAELLRQENPGLREDQVKVWGGNFQCGDIWSQLLPGVDVPEALTLLDLFFNEGSDRADAFAKALRYSDHHPESCLWRILFSGGQAAAAKIEEMVQRHLSHQLWGPKSPKGELYFYPKAKTPEAAAGELLERMNRRLAIEQVPCTVTWEDCVKAGWSIVRVKVQIMSESGVTYPAVSEVK